MKKKNKPSNSDGTMSLSGHLKELRNRIIICVICLVVFFLLGLHFAPNVVDTLTGIGKQYGYQFVYIAPQELLLQYFSIALVTGVVLSLPLILFHIWAFVQPGLKENENGLFLGAMIAGLFFFVLGVLFAYKIMLPFMLQFLIKQGQGTDYVASVSIANYISFLLLIFTIFGFIFEMPLLSVILSRLGILTPKVMRKIRGGAIIAIFVVAAIITPPDIVSQVMVAVPMVLLYELSIGLSILFQRRRKAAQEGAEEE